MALKHSLMNLISSSKILESLLTKSVAKEMSMNIIASFLNEDINCFSSVATSLRSTQVYAIFILTKSKRNSEL